MGFGKVFKGGITDQMEGEQPRTGGSGRSLKCFETLEWNLKREKRMLYQREKTIVSFTIGFVSKSLHVKMPLLKGYLAFILLQDIIMIFCCQLFYEKIC